jgi:hypothetical protein
VKAKINEGSIEGKGRLAFQRREGFQVEMKVKGIEIRTLLAQYGMDGGVGGYLDGSLLLHGSAGRPELTFEVDSPLTVKETLVDRLKVTIISPARGKFDLNAQGHMGALVIDLKGHMERNKDGWGYAAETGLLDLNQLISAKTPSMKDQLSGKIKARVTGRLNSRARQDGRKTKEQPTPINILVSLPTFAAAGFQVDDISLPIRVEDDHAKMCDGSAAAYDGKINLVADVDLINQQWNATAKVMGLDFAQAAQSFLKEGAVVGSADINIQMKGDFGTLMMVFANGDFKSSEGDIHGFEALKKIAHDGRVAFKEIRGSFFWNGQDLWLNPGTQVTAPPGAPLYRYFAVNGPLGVLGKGLALNCQGRFDVHALNTVLGALKGAFQLMTGSLTGGGQLARQALGKIIGLSERDFQDVSFQLKGSWQELQLLNLKIDKSLETYIPLQNDEPTSRSDSERKFQINIKIPTGPGSGGDDEDTKDQFKKQLLDGLLNQMDF